MTYKIRVSIVVVITSIFAVSYGMLFFQRGIDVGNSFLPKKIQSRAEDIIYERKDKGVRVIKKELGVKEIELINLDVRNGVYLVTYNQNCVAGVDNYNIKIKDPNGRYFEGTYILNLNHFLGDEGNPIDSAIFFDIIKIAIGEADTIRGNIGLFLMAIFILLEALVAWKFPWLFRYDSITVIICCGCIAVVMLIVAVVI